MKETSQSRYDSWKFMFEKGDPKEMGRKRRRRKWVKEGGEEGGGEEGGGGEGGGGGAKGGKGEGGRDEEERENGEAEPRQSRTRVEHFSSCRSVRARGLLQENIYSKRFP
ncbi:hypothetical protein V1477_016415 [Vespula maculifrons]|uniref:Uncharacterized protein n=1 Tax=Vespula maculifrons TaxID=7453 RepID=A0ABD2BD42_VESMC